MWNLIYTRTKSPTWVSATSAVIYVQLEYMFKKMHLGFIETCWPYWAFHPTMHCHLQVEVLQFSPQHPLVVWQASQVSACDFSNLFQPSISRIGKPNSHDHYSSQHETPYPLYLYLLYVNHTKLNKEQYCHWRRLLVQLYLVSTMGYTVKFTDKCLSWAKGFDNCY